MLVRLKCVISGEIIDYRGEPGDRYEDALLASGINPDTVLLFYEGDCLPQDKPIEEDEVEVFETCSRG